MIGGPRITSGFKEHGEGQRVDATAAGDARGEGIGASEAGSAPSTSFASSGYVFCHPANNF